MTRLFYEEEFKEVVALTDSEKVHHLSTVLRVRKGDDIYLINKFSVGHYQVDSATKECIILNLIEQFEENNELDIGITLGFGPLKGDNTQLVIQKAVELGVKQIDLVNFKRNVSKFDNKKAEKKIQKFKKIIEGACNQSRRNQAVDINVNVNLSEEYANEYDLVLVCYENERSTHINHVYNEITEGCKVLVLIGPEGGISDEEISFLEDLNNIRIVTLGARILRAETASIAALSMLAASREGN